MTKIPIRAVCSTCGSDVDSERYRRTARKAYDGSEVSIDHDATVVIIPAGGAFVQAWIWVSNEDVAE